MRVSVSGTCLMQTAIFIPGCLSTQRPQGTRRGRRVKHAPGRLIQSLISYRSVLCGLCGFSAASAWKSSSTFITAEKQRAVGAAEPEGVRERVPDVGLAGDVGHDVQVALRIRVLVVDGRGKHLGLEDESGDARLQAARGPEQVARHRLGRADRHPTRVVAEDALE